MFNLVMVGKKSLFEDERFVKVHLVGVATGPSLTLFCFLLDSGERERRRGREREGGEGGRGGKGGREGVKHL